MMSPAKAAAALIVTIQAFSPELGAKEVDGPGSVNTAPTEQISEAESVYQLDTVTVTAEKRKQNLQVVPLSVQVFDVGALFEENVRTIQQLDFVVPALQFSNVAGFPIVFIRGVGTDNFVPSADPSIATYIDGIYTPIGMSSFNSLAGIKSVEVVKGPQGTLFGRDAVAGAINLVTDEPGSRVRASSHLEFGNNNRLSTGASLDGPITSWLGASIAGVYSSRDSDFRATQFTVDPDRIKSGRVKVRLHHEDVALTLTAYRGEQSGPASLIGQNVAPSPTGRLLGIRAQENDFTTDNDYESSQRTRQNLYYGNFVWHAPWFDVKVLGSHQNLTTPLSRFDFDASPAPLAALKTSNTYQRIKTAEIQLVSTAESPYSERLDWLAGVYYLTSRSGADPGIIQLFPGLLSSLLDGPSGGPLGNLGSRIEELVAGLGLGATPLGPDGLGLAFRGVIGTRSLSSYAQVGYRITDEIRFSVGGRVQREKRFLTTSQTDLVAPSGDSTIPLNFTERPGQTADTFSPRVSLSYQVSESAFIYGAYGVAYKSGTYNIVNIFQEPEYIEPERATSFEIGAKYQSIGGSLRINGAVFADKVNNLQLGFVSLMSGGVVNFETVPETRSRGFEFDGTWLAVQGKAPLALSFSGSYIDSAYTDFPSGPGFSQTDGTYEGDLDLSGNRTIYTPWFSGTVGLMQGIRVPEGTYEFAVAGRYNGGYFTDADNTTQEPAFYVLNARLGYRHDAWKLGVFLFSSNLLDRRYRAVNVETDFGRVQSLARGRDVGLRLTWNW